MYTKDLIYATSCTYEPHQFQMINQPKRNVTVTEFLGKDTYRNNEEEDDDGEEDDAEEAARDAAYMCERG
ncbi:hypothetical protein FQR65_LT18420 [Abscondita terminalis]|nr:hypothetical protein FQR65_LT18420 [Abscondita terminalis]